MLSRASDTVAVFAFSLEAAARDDSGPGSLSMKCS